MAESAVQQAPAASGLSALFSLSQAAACAPPIPLPIGSTESTHLAAHSLSSSVGGKQAHMKHRRLSSTGQMRRRLSDARDAAQRPSIMHNAASALASLSLVSATSISPSSHTHSHMHTRSQSQARNTDSRSTPVPISGRRAVSGALAQSVPTLDFDSGSVVGDEIEVDVEDDEIASMVGTTGKKGRGKKRANIFKCESCSKVYRHPSCLIKHRWEHSPHWRESSKFLLSKHQQVQLLEAAAILSHLGPGTSLPEDRSLWPSYLSGGALPPPSPGALNVNGLSASAAKNEGAGLSSASQSNAISSSVPISANGGLRRPRSGSVSTTMSVSTSAAGAGPRMHNYTIGRGSGITQIRPGLLGIPTPPAANTPPTNGHVSAGLPVVPFADEDDEELDDEGDAAVSKDSSSHSGLSMTSPGKPAPMAVPLAHTHSGKSMNGGGVYGPYRDAMPGSGGFSFNSSISAGWSLPSSDIRSGSVARSYSEVGSVSRDGSGSRSEDEVLVSDDEYDGVVDGHGHDGHDRRGGNVRGESGSLSGRQSAGEDEFVSVAEPVKSGYIGYSFAGRRSTMGGGGYDVGGDRHHHGSDEGRKAIDSQETEWMGMDMDMD